MTTLGIYYQSSLVLWLMSFSLGHAWCFRVEQYSTKAGSGNLTCSNPPSGNATWPLANARSYSAANNSSTTMMTSSESHTGIFLAHGRLSLQHNYLIFPGTPDAPWFSYCYFCVDLGSVTVTLCGPLKQLQCNKLRLLLKFSWSLGA